MRTCLILSATFATLLNGNAVAAGPREGPELAEAIVVETPALADWMQRMQGRFNFDGVVYGVKYLEPSNGGPPVPFEELSMPVAKGKADCTGFADGPGVQCVVYVDWAGEEGTLESAVTQGLTYFAPQTQVYNPPGNSIWASRLKPGMVLAGVAPSSPATIRFLLVDDRGLAQPGTLALSGNAAIAKPPCVNQPGKICEQKFRVEAGPDASIVFVTLSVRMTYQEVIVRNGVVIPAPIYEPNLTSDRPPPTSRKSNVTRVEELLEISFALRREAQEPQAGESPQPGALP